MAEETASVVEAGVFRRDHETVSLRVIPNRFVVRGVQLDQTNLS